MFLRPASYATHEKNLNLTNYRQDNYLSMSPEMKDNAMGGGRDGVRQVSLEALIIWRKK